MSKFRDTELRFHRLTDRPILTPDSDKDWEAGGVFNPAVIKHANKYVMLYRAFGKDKISRLGYAESSDGLSWIKQSHPIVEPDPVEKQENRGVEDPRIVRLNGEFYITYTAAKGFPVRKSWRWRTAIGVLKTRDFKTFVRIRPVINGVNKQNDKDAVLFSQKSRGKYYLLHRMIPDIHIAESTDLLSWQEQGTVIKNRRDSWSYKKVGAAAPPILTDIGWLMIYHGVRKDRSYALGAALLDSRDPTRLTHLLPYPLLEPERPYELVGVVPRVVFGTSLLEVEDTFRVYYGAADRVIGVAAINKADLLEALLENKVSVKIKQLS